MLKENLQNEKIQTENAAEFKQENFQECGEQNSEEEFNEPSWRSRALKLLNHDFSCGYSILVSYQIARLIDDSFSPFVPYHSYAHFTISRVYLDSIVLGACDNLEPGVYLFKLLSYYKYFHNQWVCDVFPPDSYFWYTLKIKVFDDHGKKGFEVLDCFSNLNEVKFKNEI